MAGAKGVANKVDAGGDISADAERLGKAVRMFGRAEVAKALGVSPARVSVLRKDASALTPAERVGLMGLVAPNDGKRRKGTFDFIDLFAGIGGIRMGVESAGGRCVFTSEWNEHAQKTYMSNFRDGHEIFGDITKIDAGSVPDHHVLVGGFPCQPFSIAGVSKKNSLGRAHGFADKTQGTLFFDVARILAEKRPAAFLLENVKNLVSHDKGNTFRVILETLRDELGYEVHHRVIDGKRFVPQHRERIIIVGFREPTSFSWDEVPLPEQGPTMSDILHPEDGTETSLDPRCVDPATGKVLDRFTLSDKLWAYLQGYAEKHRASGNGFGFGLVGPDSVSRTLSARYYKDGSEILVSRGAGNNPRKLTPRECARLMGFPESFRYAQSDMQAYKQFGNSVVVPVIEAVAKAMAPHVERIIAEKSQK